MLYCDLTVNGTVIFTGMPCLNGVPIGNYGYVIDASGLTGALFFSDTQGTLDPSSPGLNSRYEFIFYDPAVGPVQIPILDEPAQQFDILLSTQQCTISLYTT
jgi:hypothetical protein